MEMYFIIAVAIAAGIALIFYAFYLILGISVYVPAIIGVILIIYGFIIQSKYFNTQKPWDIRFIKIGIAFYYFSNLTSIYFNAGEIHNIDYLIAARSIQDFSFFLFLIVALSYTCRRFADFIFDYRADMAKRSREAQQAREKAEQERQNANDKANDPYFDDVTMEQEAEEKALEILGMKRPFTLAELNKKRKDLLKIAHPDGSGSNFLASIINQAYDLLKSKASDA